MHNINLIFTRGAVPHHYPSRPCGTLLPWKPTMLNRRWLAHTKCKQAGSHIHSLQAGGILGRQFEVVTSLIVPRSPGHQPPVTTLLLINTSDCEWRICSNPNAYPLHPSSSSITSVFKTTLQRDQYHRSGTIWQNGCRCRFSPPLLGLHLTGHKLKRNNSRPSPLDVVCKPLDSSLRNTVSDYGLFMVMGACLFWGWSR